MKFLMIQRAHASLSTAIALLHTPTPLMIIYEIFSIARQEFRAQRMLARASSANASYRGNTFTMSISLENTPRIKALRKILPA